MIGQLCRLVGSNGKQSLHVVYHVSRHGIRQGADRVHRGNIESFVLRKTGGEVGDLLRIAVIDGQLIEVPMAFAEQSVHRLVPTAGAGQCRGLCHIAHNGERS